jgi:hypothetical protein
MMAVPQFNALHLALIENLARELGDTKTTFFLEGEVIRARRPFVCQSGLIPTESDDGKVRGIRMYHSIEDYIKSNFRLNRMKSRKMDRLKGDIVKLEETLKALINEMQGHTTGKKS